MQITTPGRHFKQLRPLIHYVKLHSTYEANYNVTKPHKHVISQICMFMLLRNGALVKGMSSRSVAVFYYSVYFDLIYSKLLVVIL